MTTANLNDEIMWILKWKQAQLSKNKIFYSSQHSLTQEINLLRLANTGEFSSEFSFGLDISASGLTAQRCVCIHCQ
jgi:hypothetical protein